MILRKNRLWEDKMIWYYPYSDDFKKEKDVKG